MNPSAIVQRDIRAERIRPCILRFGYKLPVIIVFIPAGKALGRTETERWPTGSLGTFKLHFRALLVETGRMNLKVVLPGVVDTAAQGPALGALLSACGKEDKAS